MLPRIFLFLSIILLVACDKNAPKRNELFFCQVNGVAFRPGKSTKPIGGVGGDPLRTYWYPKEKLLAIYASNNPENIAIRLRYLSETITEGDYIFSNDNLKSYASYTPNYNISNPEEIFSISGNLTITKSIGTLISGNFNFIGKYKSGKEINITNGCFNGIDYK